MFEKALSSRSHYFEHVKNLANNDQGRPGDLTWAPAIHGFTLVTHRLAVVEKNLVRGGMLVHLLTEFDDDALSLYCVGKRISIVIPAISALSSTTSSTSSH